MKITEYTNTKKIGATDVMLTDGTNGTRIIAGADLPYALMDLCGPQMHRMTYRGKNLGGVLTSEQKAAIQAGTFDDLWLGDYWTLGGVNYRIADFDYWYNRGDTAFTSHHLAIVPETNLGTAKMNSTSTTTGGWTGSEMYTTNLTPVKETINAAFGTNVLTHREYLINTVTNGYPSAGGWTDSTVELMNEPMVYGSYIYTPASDGVNANIVKRYTNSQTQLALFMVCPQFINSTAAGTRLSYWLRDVASTERFARVTDYGPVTDSAASLEYGIRPVFAIG